MFWYFKQNFDNWCLKLIQKLKDTLNEKLKPPVGGSMSLLISESFAIEPNHLYGWFIH